MHRAEAHEDVVMNAKLDRDELFRLFGGLSNETLTAPEQARLEVILSGSGEARKLWFLYCDMERGLALRKPPLAHEPARPLTAHSTPQGTRSRVSWGWAIAASVVFAALLGSLMFFSSGTANAATVVQRALKAHAALLDRCYRLEVLAGKRAVSPRKQESLLWTRGDRFWNHIEADGKSLAWGRDEAGGVWFALSRKEGARLAANEVPEALQTACELRSLELESLLRTILADFDLRREPESGGRDVIYAERMRGRRSKYRSALLEMDAESGVLRRVELHREHEGRVVATLTASLVESRLQDEAAYTLEGHLDADAALYARDNGRGYRGRLLMSFFDLIRVRPLP
jgi:hypothetical protein